MKWIDEAKKFIGTKEIKGPQHNKKIVDLWAAAKLSGIKDDETPWCAGFVGGILETVGVRSARSDAARSYLNWGIKLNKPIYGCIVIFSRGQGGQGGHVGFVVGMNKSGDLLVLGGNQGDEVNVKAFPTDRVLGYRWPTGEPLTNKVMPTSTAEFSTRES